MGRIYTVTFDNVSVAAAQDLIQVLGASGKICKILREWVNCTDTSGLTSQQIYGRSRYLPATVTNGSGGSTPTPRKRDQGDAAATFTAFANNTTPATSNATAVEVNNWGVNSLGGYDWSYSKGKEPTVNVSTAFTFELLSTVSGTVHMSGGVEVEEIG